MPTAYDVPPAILIERLTEYIKEEVPEVKPPEWALYVKTGVGRKTVPTQDDWWYRRAAAVLRKIYLYGPLGIETLRTMYGSRGKFGVRREHHRKGSGAVIRRILQQLESAGLISKTPKGRVVTPKGRSIVDQISTDILRELAKSQPELRKYLPVGRR